MWLEDQIVDGTEDRLTAPQEINNRRRKPDRRWLSKTEKCAGRFGGDQYSAVTQGKGWTRSMFNTGLVTNAAAVDDDDEGEVNIKGKGFWT